MMKIILFAISQCFAQVSFLPKEERYKKKVIEQKVSIKKSAPKRSLLDIALKRQNKEIDKILKGSMFRPLVIDGTKYVPTGTAIQGRLLNSIVSTNLESPVLIEVTENNKFFEIGTKFSCFGSTKHKRVQTSCNRVITEKGEGEVQVVALNMDGSSGLRGKYYEGKEAYVAGMLAANMATGILSASQERLNTSIGQVIVPTTKNKILEGLIQTAQTGNDLLKDELKTNEPVVVVEAGKEVVIYFQSRFKRSAVN